MKCLKHHSQRLATGLLLGICALNVHFAHAATDCSAVTEIPVSECQSLLELYNSTGGANWINNGGWNQTNTPCTWFGVTCDVGHIQKIDFFYFDCNNLIGTIPDLNLPNLTQLYLDNNQLSGSVPNFTNLPNLQVLYLLYNQLSGSIPNFANLPKLQVLYLNVNQLSGSIPNFSNLPKLQVLYLWNNQLSGSVPNFSNLPKLQVLYLWNNQLSGSVPNFSNLPNLTILWLFSNQLSGSIPNFTNLPNLTGLSLGDNQLSGSIPNFNNLPNLTGLYLYSNQLSGSIPNFTNLPNLTWLSLDENQLSGNIPNFTSFNLANFDYARFNNNCGLTAYDAAQEVVLSQKDSLWKTQNPNCSGISQCATFTPPVVNVPCVNVGRTVYKAGMNLISNTPTMRFEVDMNNLQPNNLIPNEQCAVFPAPNTSDHLKINCLDLGDKYWVDLKLVNTPNVIQFDLVNFAKN